MGSPLDLIFSAGVVHKLLLKRHNRMRRRMCSESATSGWSDLAGTLAPNKKAGHRPAFLFLIFRSLELDLQAA
jgi:hypothetical protein